MKARKPALFHSVRPPLRRMSPLLMTARLPRRIAMTVWKFVASAIPAKMAVRSAQPAEIVMWNPALMVPRITRMLGNPSPRNQMAWWITGRSPRSARFPTRKVRPLRRRNQVLFQSANAPLRACDGVNNAGGC